MLIHRATLSHAALRASATIVLVLCVLSACTRPAAGTLPVPSGSASVPTVTGNPAQHQIGATQTASTLLQKITPTTAIPVSKTKIPTTTPTITDTPPLVTIGLPKVYQLSAGESLYCIARRFDLDIGELLSLNHLLTESQPQPGTIIQLPQTGHPWSSGERMLLPRPGSYTVSVGDTLGGIACAYGDLTPEQIIEANQLTVNTSLAAGQILIIP